MPDLYHLGDRLSTKSYNKGMDIDLPGWLPAPSTPVIPEAEIHIYRILLRVPARILTPLTSVLTEKERSRADHFFRELDRNRYIAAHAGMHTILSRYVQANPVELQFARHAGGKPYLVTPESHLEINLSHSGIWGLLAVTRNMPVGVDIEEIREDLDVMEVARQHFQEPEVALLQSQSKSQQVESFFNHWVQKEARLKADGRGFAAGEMLDDEAARRWVIYPTPPIPGYAAAAACGTGCRLLCYSFLDWE